MSLKDCSSLISTQLGDRMPANRWFNANILLLLFHVCLCFPSIFCLVYGVFFLIVLNNNHHIKEISFEKSLEICFKWFHLRHFLFQQIILLFKFKFFKLSKLIDIICLFFSLFCSPWFCAMCVFDYARLS